MISEADVELEQSSPRRASRLTLAWVLLDIVAVCVFAGIGKASHGGAWWAFLDAAWFFLIGLAVAWIAVSALGRAGAGVRWGLLVWAITLLGGLTVRVAAGHGAPLSFAIVTGAVLLVLMIGWRAAAALMGRARR